MRMLFLTPAQHSDGRFGGFDCFENKHNQVIKSFHQFQINDNQVIND
jgi:hypothetical protein